MIRKSKAIRRPGNYSVRRRYIIVFSNLSAAEKAAAFSRPCYPLLTSRERLLSFLQPVLTDLKTTLVWNLVFSIVGIETRSTFEGGGNSTIKMPFEGDNTTLSHSLVHRPSWR